MKKLLLALLLSMPLIGCLDPAKNIAPTENYQSDTTMLIYKSADTSVIVIAPKVTGTQDTIMATPLRGRNGFNVVLGYTLTTMPSAYSFKTEKLLITEEYDCDRFIYRVIQIKDLNTDYIISKEQEWKRILPDDQVHVIVYNKLCEK